VRWLALVLLALAPGADAWEVVCGQGGAPCATGYDRARTPWTSPEPRNEHRALLALTMAAAGLPAELQEPFTLRVFTRDETLPGGVPTLRPVFADAARVRERTTTIPAMADLPDMAYTLWDWATGNERCPPDPSSTDAQDCHDYETHIGPLNANHWPPQSRRWFEHLHALALGRARACKEVHDRLGAADRTRFAPYLRACEREALVIEGVAHHYLQDAWAAGHMWERWGGVEIAAYGTRTMAAAVAAVVGLIHGAGALLGSDDPLNAPHPLNYYLDAAPEAAGTGPLPRRGVGDLFAADFLDGDPAYAPQRRALLGCGVHAVREVYAATAQVHGGLQSVSGDFDPARSVHDDSCWAQRATNIAMAEGCGLHLGRYPDQQRLFGGLVPPRELFDQGEEVAAVVGLVATGGILQLAQQFFEPARALDGLPVEEALAFRRDAAAACTLAAARALEEPLAADVAAGGFPSLAGVQPNAFYARGGAPAPTELPAPYADPFLPWDLGDPNPIVRERKEALHLTFADAHVADRCTHLTEEDLAAHRDAALAVRDAPDAELAAARCEQCARMVAPHLRFGVPGDHDVRREAFCAAAAPGTDAFVYTQENPASFTGDEPTDLESVLAAAARWCCGEEAAPPLVLEPAEVTLAPGGTQRFTATRDGAPVDVQWEVTGGTIDATGLYTAGPVSGTFDVVARATPLGPGDRHTAIATVVIRGSGRVVPVTRVSDIIRFDEERIRIEEGLGPTLSELPAAMRPFDGGGAATASARAESSLTLDAEGTVLEMHAAGAAAFTSAGPDEDAAFFANNQRPLSSVALEFDVVGGSVRADMEATLTVAAQGPCPARDDAFDCQAIAAFELQGARSCVLYQNSSPNATRVPGTNGTFQRTCSRTLVPGRYRLTARATPEGTREPGTFSMSGAYEARVAFTP
jgi:hypothetical protein